MSSGTGGEGDRVGIVIKDVAVELRVVKASIKLEKVLGVTHIVAEIIWWKRKTSSIKILLVFGTK